MRETARHDAGNALVGKREAKVRADMGVESGMPRDAAHRVEVGMDERISQVVHRHGHGLPGDLIHDLLELVQPHLLSAVAVLSLQGDSRVLGGPAVNADGAMEIV